MTATTSFGTMSTKTRRFVIAGAVVIVIGGTVWAIASSRDDARKKSAAGAIAGMEGMEGMGGMDVSSDGSVRLTAAQMGQFGITFGTVELRTLEAETRTAGAVTFDETRLSKVAPRVGGFVERLYVDFTGKPVRRGEPLLELYSPELVAAQEELLLARRLERTVGESAVPGVPGGSADLLGAATRRLRLWEISEGQIEEILRTGRVRRTLTLFSPASGVVLEKNVVQGQAIEPGMTLYTIADLSEVWVDIELRENDASMARAGAGADIDVAGLPGRVFKGRVEYVYPTLQEESRTTRARVAVTNTDRALKPGMYAIVRLSAPGQRALTVANSALIRTGERTLVFVDMGDGRLMPHEVETGRRAGEYTEVLAGVEPGQRVVTSAQFLLESESNLGEVMRAMMGQMGAGDSPRSGQMGNMRDRPGIDVPVTDTPGMDMKGADMKGMKMPADSPPPRR